MHHLASTEVLHVFEAGNRRAEVQRVNERYFPFRVVYQTKKSGEVMRDDESAYWTHAPSYHVKEEKARSLARRWAYQMGRN